MEYKVVVTIDAEKQLESYILYLLKEKKSEQAASNLLNDFAATEAKLSYVADSLKLCDNPKFRKLGYRRISFVTYNYFILYRIVGDTVIIDSIFHELQDFLKCIK